MLLSRTTLVVVTRGERISAAEMPWFLLAAGVQDETPKEVTR